jgi:hypothetical protein
LKPSKQTRRRGESLLGKPGGTRFAKLVAPVLAVCIFRYTGVIPEIPEFFPETLEYPSLTDKIVLSGDFQDSPIHPPLGHSKIFSMVIDNKELL